MSARIRLGKELDQEVEKEATRRGIEPSTMVKLIIGEWLMNMTEQRTKKGRGRPPIIRTEVAKDA